jgi:hypothetical protein
LRATRVVGCEVIPDRYTGLEEIESESYEARTRMNVEHSDATLILSHGPLQGGSKFTEVVATKHEKPVLHVYLGVTSIPDAVIAIRAWLSGLEGV